MSRHVRSEPPRRRGRLAGLLVVATAGTAAAAWALGPLRDADDAVPPAAAPTPSASVTPAPTPTPTPTPEPPADAVFTILAAGDVLTHQAVNRSARTGDGFDFGPLFAPLDAWVSGADLALCHMEVPIAPPGTSPSGFPMFGAPAEIARFLRVSGWDGCSTASNHSVDRGMAGVVATLDAFDAVGLGHVGTARTAEEAAAPQVYTLYREGQAIRVAHVAATYGTNGLPVPVDSPWAVQLIDTAQIVAQATAAREAGADLVLASVHCCVEYTSSPTTEQERIASELAASGVVDLLIGHHAHVPQPVALLPGGPRGEGMWVAYGLGNFISNQGPHEGLPAESANGLLAIATVTKPPDGPARVTGMEWAAITVDVRAGHRVEALSAGAAAGQGLGTLSAAEVVARHGRVAQVAGTQATERTTPPVATGLPPVVLARGAPAAG